jgi:hypothetical protein
MFYVGYVQRVETSFDVVTPDLARKFFRSSWRYQAEYKNGVTGPNIESIIKEKRRHRGATDHPDEAGPSRRRRGTFNRSQHVNMDNCDLPSLDVLMAPNPQI